MPLAGFLWWHYCLERAFWSVSVPGTCWSSSGCAFLRRAEMSGPGRVRMAAGPGTPPCPCLAVPKWAAQAPAPMQGGNQTSQTEQIALAADCRSTRSSSEAGPGALSAVNSPVCALRAAPSSGDEGPATIHAGSVQELDSGLAPVHGNRCLLRVMWRVSQRARQLLILLQWFLQITKWVAVGRIGKDKHRAGQPDFWGRAKGEHG